MVVERVRQVMEGIEQAEGLDGVVDPVLGRARDLTGSSARVKNLLSGTWLGHRLHPLMTDAVIGPWLSAWVLDLVGGERAEGGADGLVAIGVLTSIPTAVAGASDWSDAAERTQHRSGLVHAAANTIGLGLQIASLVDRRRGNRGRAKVLSTVAMGFVGIGGYVGGHLTYVQGVGVDHPTGDLTTDWHRAVPFDDLVENEPRGVTVDGVDIVLVRRGGVVHAMAATCTHAGGPLAEGSVEGGCITCPWHGSSFTLVDASIVRGPATTPQPVYETRLVDDHIEVRAAP